MTRGRRRQAREAGWLCWSWLVDWSSTTRTTKVRTVEGGPIFTRPVAIVVTVLRIFPVSKSVKVIHTWLCFCATEYESALTGRSLSK